MPTNPPFPPLPPGSPGNKLLKRGWERQRNPKDPTHKKIWTHPGLSPEPVTLEEAVSIQREEDNNV